ncbi:MAG TPA: acyl-CoA thioesterase II [Pseudonocardiaceae bacterium]|jgi:acyl-CoA thioesterase-2|nr:acyl-CoA thioesterase II [Pseudonocardiaceae bacterium]
MTAPHDDPGIPLDLEHVEIGLYRGHPRLPSLPSTFGGEVVAQALRAAGDTVAADRPVHSLHAYFVRPGDPRTPVLYRVEDCRDGGSFTTRRVTAQQHGKAILAMMASFHRVETGASHQHLVADAPPPESIPTFTSVDGDIKAWFGRLAERFPVELRFVDPPPPVAAGQDNGARPRFRFWLRTRHPLPPDPLKHACAAAYASDLLLLSTAAAQHGFVLGQPGLRMASLDHALWFHEAFRADDWLLYEQESHWAGRSRALCRGSLFDRSGTLVATVAQEGLFRFRPPGA